MKRANLFLFLFCLFLAVPSQARIITVDDNGPPADFNTIQAAINDANYGDTVIVAKGTYNENINIGGKNITLISTDPNDPNVVRDTIIQGDGTSSVVTFSGSEDARCSFSGFAITGGYKYQKAGGVEGNYTWATISHCMIYGNRSHHSAGGISSWSGLINNCTITNNSSHQTGGIRYSWGTITNCNISNNKGDGLYRCYGPISNNTISKNSGHGLLYCYGEIAQCIISGNTKLGLAGCSGPIHHCVIIGNTYWLGGGVKSCGSIDSCAIVGNIGVWGGGLSECDFISNCVIVGNSASYGGGVFCSEVSSTIINCTIINNRASDDGGGICCVGNDAFIDNCIISDNTATRGDEIALIENFIIIIGDSIYYIPSTASVSYTALKDGPEEVFVDSNCTLIWDYGNINNDPCFINPGYWDPNSTPSNEEDDFWVDGDYHLKSQAGRWDPNSQSWVQDDVTSPCIDAGNPGCPLGSEPVPNGNRRNMGAFGGTAEASKSPANWRSIADLTNDWIVDFNDLKVFVHYWLGNGECIPSDLNRNQSVDFADYGIFALQWSYPSASEPSMTFQIDDCDMEEGQSWPVAAESNEPRFSLWVEGRYIHFEDLMYANCCPDELGLESQINGNQITLYEIGYGGLCDCMCYFPIKATLGPFEDGTYTVEVYDNYGKSLGVVEVTIGETTGPGITYQIEDCNQEAPALFSAEPPGQTRFTVTVEGQYIRFKDMMAANCCPDELGLEMTVEDNLITIYETEYTPGGCHCVCDFPVTATLGPFQPGIYTLEVYESGHFIGSTTVVIAPPE